jgi:hypothetical protein
MRQEHVYQKQSEQWYLPRCKNIDASGRVPSRIITVKNKCSGYMYSHLDFLSVPPSPNPRTLPFSQLSCSLWHHRSADLDMLEYSLR